MNAFTFPFDNKSPVPMASKRQTREMLEKGRKNWHFGRFEDGTYLHNIRFVFPFPFWIEKKSNESDYKERKKMAIVLMNDSGKETPRMIMIFITTYISCFIFPCQPFLLGFYLYFPNHSYHYLAALKRKNRRQRKWTVIPFHLCPFQHSFDILFLCLAERRKLYGFLFCFSVLYTKM